MQGLYKQEEREGNTRAIAKLMTLQEICKTCPPVSLGTIALLDMVDSEFVAVYPCKWNTANQLCALSQIKMIVGWY